jgi:hypothetical protein
MFWVITQVYGRGHIAKRCLPQLRSVLPEHAVLHVWDDHSPADVSWLQDMGAVHRESQHLGRKTGIEYLRRVQIATALNAGVDEVYLTDTDAMHDPGWYGRAVELYAHGAPVCLYNTRHHIRNIVSDNGDYLVSRHAAGISWYFRRKELERLAAMPVCMPGWDWRFADALGNRCIISKTSYVEHYGAGGTHNKAWDSDVAVNPTSYLVEQRKAVLPLMIADEGSKGRAG